LAILADSRRPVDRDRWLGIMLDRLGLVTPRLALSGSEVEAEAGDALAALQMGLDLIDLRAALDRIEPARRQNVHELMATLSRFFRTCAVGGAADPIERQRVLSAIDGVIREIGGAQPGQMRRLGLGALIGLRRTVFPDAPPFAGEAKP
jgi:hypothetical protein